MYFCFYIQCWLVSKSIAKLWQVTYPKIWDHRKVIVLNWEIIFSIKYCFLQLSSHTDLSYNQTFNYHVKYNKDYVISTSELLLPNHYIKTYGSLHPLVLHGLINLVDTLWLVDCYCPERKIFPTVWRYIFGIWHHLLI